MSHAARARPPGHHLDVVGNPDLRYVPWIALVLTAFATGRVLSRLMERPPAPAPPKVEPEPVAESRPIVRTDARMAQRWQEMDARDKS